jgi:predicted phosphodiesterase
MTTLAALADVHANLPALQAVLQDIQSYAVDGIIVAGDLTGGPKPDETIHLLQEAGSQVILGNSDINLLRYESGQSPPAWRTSQQFALLRWADRNTGPTARRFLRSLPEQLMLAPAGAAPLRVVHGSPRDPYESILPDIDPSPLSAFLQQIPEQVLICGHTHQPWVYHLDGKMGLNPAL